MDRLESGASKTSHSYSVSSCTGGACPGVGSRSNGPPMSSYISNHLQTDTHIHNLSNDYCIILPLCDNKSGTIKSLKNLDMARKLTIHTKGAPIDH